MLIRYFGAAKAASGTEEENLPQAGPGGDGDSVPGGMTLDGLLEFLSARHVSAPDGTPPLKSVISRSTFLVNGYAARDRSLVLSDGDTVDILPPFAGG